MGCKCKEIKEEEKKRDRVKRASEQIDRAKNDALSIKKKSEGTAEKAVSSIKAVSGRKIPEGIDEMIHYMAEAKEKCDEKISELDTIIENLKDEDEEYHKKEREKSDQKGANDGNNRNE